MVWMVRVLRRIRAKKKKRKEGKNKKVEIWKRDWGVGSPAMGFEVNYLNEVMLPENPLFHRPMTTFLYFGWACCVTRH